MRKLWRGEGSLNYSREGPRSKGSSRGGGKEGRLLSKLILATVSCLLEPGCFWLRLEAMSKCCFGILKGGESREGTGNSYYGGDIVAGVFSCWRAKTPPTTEWFLPGAGMMVNTSAWWSGHPPPPTVYYTLPTLVVTRSGPLQPPLSLTNTFFGWTPSSPF